MLTQLLLLKPSNKCIKLNGFVISMPVLLDVAPTRWDAHDHAARVAERARLAQQRSKLQALGLGCQWEGKVQWQVSACPYS